MQKNYVVGLDIGGTKCAVLLADVNNGIRLMDKLRFSTETENGFEYSWNNICMNMENILHRNDLEWTQILAIGVSCGGPLDSRAGTILCPPNLPGWNNIPITQMLSERYGAPAYLQNDANACALVEWKLGAGRGVDDMVFLTMGTGMGGGIIVNGRLLCGISDMAGEIGHLRLSENGPIGFGKAGSFEGFTSGGGIQRQAQALTEALLNEGKTPAWFIKSQSDNVQIDAPLMAEYARSGDPDAKAFFQHIGKMLGRGISYIVDTLNPARIVIGSIFARCEDLLRTPMEEELKKEAISFSLSSLEILPAQTGEQIGDLASIMVALYALGINPEKNPELKDKVKDICDRLFERYPSLEVIREDILASFHLMRQCYENGGKVMVFGNGGSCADSEHIVGELMKGFYLKRPLDNSLKDLIDHETIPYVGAIGAKLQRGLPAIALSGHSALSTAIANDQDPLLGPAQQLLGYGQAGDVFIGISTSGNSENVLMSALTAKALNIKTIALTGKIGGKLKEICDCSIVVPSNITADIQEYHLPIYHTLCAMLEEHFFS